MIASSYIFFGYPNFGDMLNLDIAKYFGINVKNAKKDCDAVFVGSLLSEFVDEKRHFRLRYLFSPALKIWGTGFIRPPLSPQEKLWIPSVFPDISVNFVERDMWCKYRGGGLSVMQGWFGYPGSFPSQDTLPLWIGTHYTDKMRRFIKRAADANHNLFGHIGFGARDLKTLQFAQTIDSKAYLSRCYTLTLPGRALAPPNKGKVFLVNIPSAWEEYIPSALLDGAVRITHGAPDVSEAKNRAKYACNLLEKYRDEARLVITCKVHSASPCTAMGIPVVAIVESSESRERFSFMDELSSLRKQIAEYTITKSNTNSNSSLIHS